MAKQHPPLGIMHNGRTQSNHYFEIGEGRTICGLSLKGGHAWHAAKSRYIRCTNCLKSTWKHWKLDQPPDDDLLILLNISPEHISRIAVWQFDPVAPGVIKTLRKLFTELE